MDERVEVTRAALEACCRSAGHWISGDGRIGEETAAELLGYTPASMANARREGRTPKAYRLGGAGHRITYSLRDLAAWIEATRED